MKLRLRGNSLRLRLTKTEVVDLVKVGWVEEALYAGPGPADWFRYRLETSSAHDTMQSRLDPKALIVVVPATAAAEWAETTTVGLYAEMPWGLKIAIEKDFRCLDTTRQEDESDAFDHPTFSQDTSCDPGNSKN